MQADTTSRDESELARLYRDHFKPIAGIFREKDQIKLDPAAIGFVHNRLCQIDLFASDRKTRSKFDEDHAARLMVGTICFPASVTPENALKR